MTYSYLAFGIPIISEIELPALFPLENRQPHHPPVVVKLGVVPEALSHSGVEADINTYCNPTEMRYIVAEKIKFYISGGNLIVIEPISPDYRANLLYFYSNALAAVLYQRDIIPFHVSGVFTAPGKVVLFAAPSRTGKSTLALKLQEMGYQPFTDDTAVLYVENGICYAQASYPMMRLWQTTLNEQTMFKDADKQQLYEVDGLDKYGFAFHQHFAVGPVAVQEIIFLQETCATIQVGPINKLDAFKALADNVYRCHWIPALQKNKLQFVLISQILNTVPHRLATRPKGINSFELFPSTIKKVLQNQGN